MKHAGVKAGPNQSGKEAEVITTNDETQKSERYIHKTVKHTIYKVNMLGEKWNS